MKNMTLQQVKDCGKWCVAGASDPHKWYHPQCTWKKKSADGTVSDITDISLILALRADWRKCERRVGEDDRRKFNSDASGIPHPMHRDGVTVDRRKVEEKPEPQPEATEEERHEHGGDIPKPSYVVLIHGDGRARRWNGLMADITSEWGTVYPDHIDGGKDVGQSLPLYDPDEVVCSKRRRSKAMRFLFEEGKFFFPHYDPTKHTHDPDEDEPTDLAHGIGQPHNYIWGKADRYAKRGEFVGITLADEPKSTAEVLGDDYDGSPTHAVIEVSLHSLHRRADGKLHKNQRKVTQRKDLYVVNGVNRGQAVLFDENGDGQLIYNHLGLWYKNRRKTDKRSS